VCEGRVRVEMSWKIRYVEGVVVRVWGREEADKGRGVVLDVGLVGRLVVELELEEESRREARYACASSPK
jgi:hypothetical protein